MTTMLLAIATCMHGLTWRYAMCSLSLLLDAWCEPRRDGGIQTRAFSSVSVLLGCCLLDARSSKQPSLDGSLLLMSVGRLP
jgi:hypothetical protein